MSIHQLKDSNHFSNALLGLSWAGVATSAISYAHAGLGIMAAAISLVAGLYHLRINVERWRRMKANKEANEA